MDKVLTRALTLEHNERILIRVLEECKIRKRNIVIWDIVNNLKVEIEALIVEVNRNKQTYQLKVEKKNIEKLINLISGQECLYLSIPSEKILTFAKFHYHVSDEIFCVGFPAHYSYSRINRRLHERYLNIHGSHIQLKFNVKYRFNNQWRSVSFQKLCTDIGEGGISFLCNKLERRYFELYSDINDISLDLEGNVLKVNSLVVRVVEVDPKNEESGSIYRGIKISVMLVGLTVEEGKTISDFVERKLLVVEREQKYKKIK